MKRDRSKARMSITKDGDELYFELRPSDAQWKASGLDAYDPITYDFDSIENGFSIRNDPDGGDKVRYEKDGQKKKFVFNVNRAKITDFKTRHLRRDEIQVSSGTFIIQIRKSKKRNPHPSKSMAVHEWCKEALYDYGFSGTDKIRVNFRSLIISGARDPDIEKKLTQNQKDAFRMLMDDLDRVKSNLRAIFSA